MGYVETVLETLDAELRKAGFSVGGEMGAHNVYVKVFVGELEKLNERLAELEAAGQA